MTQSTSQFRIVVVGAGATGVEGTGDGKSPDQFECK